MAMFLHVLLSVSDYCLFVDLMRDKDKRKWFFSILYDWRRQALSTTDDEEDEIATGGSLSERKSGPAKGK